MRRVLTFVPAVYVAAALADVHGAQARRVQQGASVRTQVGISIGKMAGVLGQPAFTTIKTAGQNVTATSTPIVRANAAWQLSVALVPPVDPKLTVKVAAAGGKTLTLDAKTPSAVVATGAQACTRCAVTLAWTFQFGGTGSSKTALTPPPINYTARPSP